MRSAFARNKLISSIIRAVRRVLRKVRARMVVFTRLLTQAVFALAVRSHRSFLPALAGSLSFLSFQRMPDPYRRSSSASKNVSAVPLVGGAKAPKRRSVLFLHNSYYHFFYLAAALRKRDWDAQLVTMHPSESPSANFFHGEDINLYNEAPLKFEDGLYDLYEIIQKRFKMVHFAGQHLMSVFPRNFDSFDGIAKVPWDFLEFKRAGKLIGYSISGCSDGQSQSAFHARTGVCERCVWQLHPEVCSDRINVSWAKKLAAVCDLISCENDWAVDNRRNSKNFHEPLTMCLDADIWHPELQVPLSSRIEREIDEIIVLHAFGNAEQRIRQGRDIKGSGAIRAAVERLREDGFKVKLVSVSNVKSSNMKFLQVQADIVVDQLNYGRYGAQARESMMLGKPTICRIDRTSEPLTSSLLECPLIDADESSIYDVLKRLILSPEERRIVGDLSRAYAMKWHSSNACAERFERVYDSLLANVTPATFELSEFGSPLIRAAVESSSPGAQLAGRMSVFQ